MHKPDPAYGPNEQDKRSVVPIEIELVDQWLGGTLDDVGELMALPNERLFLADPMPRK